MKRLSKFSNLNNCIQTLKKINLKKRKFVKISNKKWLLKNTNLKLIVAKQPLQAIKKIKIK